LSVRASNDCVHSLKLVVLRERLWSTVLVVALGKELIISTKMGERDSISPNAVREMIASEVGRHMDSRNVSAKQLL
jgi:hypothetical protein